MQAGGSSAGVWCCACGVQAPEGSGLPGCACDVKPEEDPLAEEVETEEPALGVRGLLGDRADGLQCSQLVFTKLKTAECVANGLQCSQLSFTYDAANSAANGLQCRQLMCTLQQKTWY